MIYQNGMHCIFFMDDLIKKLNMSLTWILEALFYRAKLTTAWELLEHIRRNRETWGFDLGGEGGIEIEYDCSNTYKDSGKVKETANEL